MLESQFVIHASRGPVIIMNQLQSIYSNPFKDSYSHPIHTCFAMIAINDICRWKAKIKTVSLGLKCSWPENSEIQSVTKTMSF